MLLGVHDGPLNAQAVPQKVTLIIYRKAHENRHAVGHVQQAGKSGLKVAYGGESLKQKAVHPSC